MARSDRRGQHKHGAGHDTGQATSALTDEQRAQVESLVVDTPTLAAALRSAAADGRDAVLSALAGVESAPEPVALAYAERLGQMRDADGRAAADVAQAVGELSPRKEVAREARRARLRLRSAGILPELALPAPSAHALSAATTSHETDADEPRDRHGDVSSEPAPEPLRAAGPRLVEGYVTRSREQGEVSLILGWQEGGDPNRVRGHVFALSFWHDGVRDFAVMQPMSRSAFLAETVERMRTDAQIELVPVTWAEARRLVLEALSVNEWSGAEPSAEFQRHRPSIEARLLAEPTRADQIDEVEADARRVQREGDRRYVGADLEPDEVIANWIGAWSFGDYGLAYDLLADDHPARRKQTREEYIALRRQWYQEAEPASLRLTVVREQQQRASALWVPGAAGAITSGLRKELEGFWSLVLRDEQIGGQIDELPLATLISPSTGRHWYWTGYTLERDRGSGLWLIARNRDEGAASQALGIEELQKRITDAHTAVEKITQQQPPDPRSEAAAEALRTITGDLTAALHYSDALIVRLPLDETVYRTAITDARSLGNHERAAALLEKMQGRFGDANRTRFELGVEQYLTAEQSQRQGNAQAAATWLARAVATMEAVVEAEPTAEHLQGLGELLSRQGHFNQAETRLRQGIQADPQRAMLYSDLADTLMGRASGENLDDPIPLDQQERTRIAKEALAALRDAQRLDASIPGIYTRMGAIYEVIELHDDALIAFEDAIRHDPGDADAHYTLGTLYLERKQYDRAVHEIESAVQLAPLTLQYRLALASGYALQGSLDEATRELDFIDQIQPGLPQTAELRTMLARARRAR